MQHIKSDFPKGTIVVAASFLARYYEFSMSLEGLQVPDGTRLNLARSCDVAHNFNQGVRKMEGDWVFFMGDDHGFDPHVLLKLLERDKPVIQPLVVSKIAPWRPCIMHGPYKVGMPVYRWDEIPTKGVWELPKGDFVGQAGMLVKKEVLDDIGDPWFLPGQLEQDRLQEDLYFCQRLQEKGYTIYQDSDQILSHCGHIEAKAVRTENGWVPAIKSGDRTLAFPHLVGESDSKLPDVGKGRVLKWKTA